MSDSPPTDPQLHPDIAERVRKLRVAGGPPAHLHRPSEVRAAFLAARQTLQRRAQGLDIEVKGLMGPDGRLSLRSQVVALLVRSPVACFYAAASPTATSTAMTP